MPGRGRPWKEGGLNDNTVTSDDIKQGTIKQEDIDPAYQAIIEGGGGVFDFATTAILEEEFIHSDDGLILQKYQSEEGNIFSFSGGDDQYGNVVIQTSGALAGNAGNLKSGTGSSGFSVQLKGGVFSQDTNFLQITQFLDLDDVMIFLCLSNNTVSGVTDKDAWFADGRRAIGFYYDSNADANWHAFSQNGAGDITEVDTGVAVKTTRQALSFSYTAVNDTATFFIDGVQVATINTSIPTFEMNIFSIIYNTDAFQKSMGIDGWRLTSARKFV